MLVCYQVLPLDISQNRVSLLRPFSLVFFCLHTTFLLYLLDLVNSKTTVLLALNFSPHFLPAVRPLEVGPSIGQKNQVISFTS